MAKFRYTVINPENKQLTGTINAPDIAQARTELNHLGFSVLKINELAPEEEQENEEGISTYNFEAFDTGGRKIIGKIKGADEYDAYKRLVLEYQFKVLTLFHESATPQEQSEAKLKGVDALAQQLETEQKGLAAVETALEKEFKEKQESLLKKVDFVLKKVDEFLIKFQNEIKPEEKKKIVNQMDKIQVVKRSTNLEHIQALCEDVLKKIQEKDIYLNKQKFLKEKTSAAIEAQQMISSIHKKDTTKVGVFQKLKEWDPNTSPSESLPFVQKMLHSITKNISKRIQEPPEITALKESVRQINAQLFEYVPFYLKTQDPDQKAELKKNISMLWNQRKKLKKEIKRKRKLFSQQDSSDTHSNPIIKEVNSFSGWILTFYLLYYFVGLYLSSKQIGSEAVPAGFFIYDSHIFKYLLPILFLTHAFTSIKIHFFRKNPFASFIGIPAVGILSILIISNF